MGNHKYDKAFFGIETLAGFLFRIALKDIARALKNCTKTFSKCRKYEDEAITTISACRTNPTKLKQKVIQTGQLEVRDEVWDSYDVSDASSLLTAKGTQRPLPGRL